jgi:hypothetical protein
MRFYRKFSFITATDFLASAEFPHGGKHHEQNSNLDLPPRKATGSAFFFGLLPINIVGNTYTTIHRNCGAKRKLSSQEFKLNMLFHAIPQLRNCLWQARSVGCSRTP